jgi:CubicO group peptidase (beta-lactamase class C family)
MKRSGRMLLLTGGLLAAMLTGRVSFADDYPTGDRGSMWSEPETYMIGSFRHMGEIYPSRIVHRGEAVSPLIPGTAIPAPSYDFAGATHSLEDYFGRARVTGFIVLKHGAVVFERYRLGADGHSLFTSWSMAKSIVSTLVGFAIAEGRIRSVDDAISDYVPEMKGSAFEGVPIKAVLQMSSGVDFVEDYDSGTSDSLRMWDDALQYNKVPLTRFVVEAKRAHPPYAVFNYAGVNTVALGWLVAKATGRTLSDYLSAKIWAPLGMEADARWMTDDRSARANEAAFCCLDATLRDYARFGLFMAQGGNWQGHQLLPESWVVAATHPDRPQVQLGKLYPGYSLGYQYQWWVLPSGAGDLGGFEAQGIYGQFLYVNPAQDLVIVVTSVWRKAWDEGLEQETYAVFRAFEQALR